MKTRTLLIACCIFGTACFAQQENQSNASNPGFNEAAFDEQSIREMIDRNKCDGIRFYTAMLNDTIKIMAIPTENEADMRSGWFPAKPYHASMRVNKSGIVVDKLKESQAEAACAAADASKSTFYSTYFLKKDIVALLDQENCNALKIIPTTQASPLSMEVHAVEFREGALTDLGQGTGFDLQSAYPCPPVCGPASNYVYTPR